VLEGWVIFIASVAYLGLLFAIAFWGDKRADAGRSILNNPYIYALSMAVYCTSWTFYGSVGRAATSGLDFLPIYLGPTLVLVLWPFVLEKMVRISAENRITSIADFIASRYGKSIYLGGLVTVIVVVGILPYIALQLKAVSTSFTVLIQYPEIVMPRHLGRVPLFQDTAFFVALIMALFAILFGTRHIDASEHHEGMVIAVAFESIIKLLAFLAVGFYVTYGVFDGFGDLFAKGNAVPEISHLFHQVGAGGYAQWSTLLVLSMFAIVCLPRQFQVGVVENVNPDHVRKAAWLFPLYLILINVFVLPIAIGGLLQFPDGGVDADTFVLTVAMANQNEGMALFAYIGGLSAATGMLIVATIALSTMVCNDLVVPVLLRMRWFQTRFTGDLSAFLLFVRRSAILFVLLLAYTYMRLIGESYALVTIGLVSFAAAAQFAPSLLGGIFWKGGTRAGAMTGLLLGTAMWFYTLVLPSFARSGWVDMSLIELGPFGIEYLKPYALFGLSGIDHLSHSLFWSMLVNIGGFVWVSLLSRPSDLEQLQAGEFVQKLDSPGAKPVTVWRGSAEVGELKAVLRRFLGDDRAGAALADFAARQGLNLDPRAEAAPALVSFAERQLAGVIGAASAQAVVASVTKGEVVSTEDLMRILDETSQVIEYSHELEEKSKALEETTAELRAANERLKELDRMKDNFITTVGHEFRTPLTSIRAAGEILSDNPALRGPERDRFYSVVVAETQRLTRLIDQLLDLSKMEAGNLKWNMISLDLGAVMETAVAAASPLAQAEGVRLDLDLPGGLPRVRADRDRLIQVLVNLISNAVKFCDPNDGHIRVTATVDGDMVTVDVIDNGPGVAPGERDRIFERFQQGGSGETLTNKPKGTGLGLAICREIVERFGGKVWVEAAPGRGSVFRFTLPASTTDVAD
jgi:Na+/proline symporter/nitrogen-specific signal transduction histidine kinase